ncbi:MAG: hypothetical protein ACE5ER_05910, partial [Nitrospinaceae bacterium]
METLAGLSEALHQEESWNPRLSSALTRAGIRDPEKVWAQLLQLRRQTQFPERYSGFFPQFLDCLAQSYDPDLAANNFLRLADIMQDKEHLFSQLSVAPSLLKALIILFSGSQVLSSTLLACPSHIDWLSQPETLEKTKTRDVLYREFYTLGGADSLPQNTPDLLRRFK